MVQGAPHRSGFPRKDINPNCAKAFSLGTFPDKWLYETLKMASSVKFPKAAGMPPVNLLLSKSSSLSPVSSSRFPGMPPSNSFLERSLKFQTTSKTLIYCSLAYGGTNLQRPEECDFVMVWLSILKFQSGM